MIFPDNSVNFWEVEAVCLSAEKTFGPKERLWCLNPTFSGKMSPSRSSFRYQVLNGIRSNDSETLSSTHQRVGWVGVRLLAIVALLVSYWAGRQVSRSVSCLKESYGLLGTMNHIRLLSLLLKTSSAAAPTGTKQIIRSGSTIPFSPKI
jgi:hypothetical protein